MKRTLSLALAVLLPAMACGGEACEWTDRSGRKFTAGIIASDAFRATFAMPGRRGRSDEKLAADFAAFLRRRGLKFEFDAPLPSR